jgi:glycosyltransferase involved in cell wall biosynthesis
VRRILVNIIVYNLELNGGGERVAVNLANSLSQIRDIEVKIVSIKKISLMNCHFEINDKVTIESLRNTGKSKIIDLLEFIKFFKNITNNEIVITIGSYPSALLVLSPKKIRNSGLATLHGAFNAMPKYWKYFYTILSYRLKSLVTLTEFDKKILQKHYKNVYVIPNYLPDKEYIYRDNYVKKKFIFLGRLSKEKNLTEMVELFHSFSKLNNDWVLDIYGDGDQKNNILELIKKINLGKRITMYPTSKSVEQVYSNGSILLMTSTNEGFPMVMIEAQAHGLPIISYNCETGPSEIINNGINGFLIDFGDRKNFVSSMLQLSQDAELFESFSKQSKLNSFKYDEKNIVEQWLNLIFKIT